MKNWCGAFIDWSATGDMLSGLGTIFGAGAVIFAARKGADTFSTWRRQKREERRMDLAEQILVCAYELKRSFKFIRSPVLFAGDIEALDRQLTESGLITAQSTNPEKQARRTAQAALNRVEHEQPKFDQALSLMPIGKAVFGQAVEEPLEAFWRMRNEVVASAQTYASIRVDDPNLQDFAHELQAVLWDGSDAIREHTIAQRIETAIGSLESTLLPLIRDVVTDNPSVAHLPTAAEKR